MTPAEPCADAELRARLAATPLREPAPEQVRRWQAALRELPSPARQSRWADGAAWLDAWVPTADPTADPAVDPAAAPGTAAAAPVGLTEIAGWPREDFGGPITDHPGDAFDGGDGSITDHPSGSTDSSTEERHGPVPDPAAGSIAARPGHTFNGPDGSAEERDSHVSDRTADPAQEGLRGIPEGVVAATEDLQLITSTLRSTSLSCVHNVPTADARSVANIRIGAVDKPATMATRPLTMADVTMAVAKIRRRKSSHHVAAAIGGLAAAILAVAVLGPTELTRSPSAATGTASDDGSAVTSGSTTADPAATAAGWPTNPGAGVPADSPATSPPGHPVDSEPLTLTRAQLLAVPPAGSGVGPLATPPAVRDLGPLAAPATLSICLARFGSGVQPVAARRVVLDGRAGVLLVLPTELPGRLRLLVVDPRCSSAIADDVVGR